jgi:ABC-type transporter Mla MlaB component
MMTEIKINNNLTINNVMTEFNYIKSAIKDEISNSLFINLNNINNIDASGLAMLIEIKIIAKSFNKNIKFINHTQNILGMCELYYVEL